MPRVDVEAPFSVSETLHTLKAGDGPVRWNGHCLGLGSMRVNGRDGTVFDSSYEQGAPVDFPLDGVVPGFPESHRRTEGRVNGRRRDDLCRQLPTPKEPSAGIQQGDSAHLRDRILSAEN